MGRDNIAAYGTSKIENGNTRSAMQEKRRAGRVFGKIRETDMESNVKLTKKERAEFIYLLKILQNQGDKEYDYENMIKALQYGYEYHYSDIFDCLFDEELSSEGCREVLDILEMYRGIIYSYNNLKRERKQLSLTEDDIRFPGFDGNNEGKQMSYTEYFSKDLGRYDEIEQLSHGYYNSHWPKTLILPRYTPIAITMAYSRVICATDSLA